MPVNSTAGLSGSGDVDAPVSLEGGEAGAGNVIPSAPSPVIPPSSAETHPLKLDKSRDRSPRFSGFIMSFHEWAELFREYAGNFRFSRILDGEVSLDMTNHNLSITNAVGRGNFGQDLEDATTARWALSTTSSDRAYFRLVKAHVVIPGA